MKSFSMQSEHDVVSNVNLVITNNIYYTLWQVKVNGYYIIFNQSEPAISLLDEFVVKTPSSEPSELFVMLNGPRQERKGKAAIPEQICYTWLSSVCWWPLNVDILL